MRFVPVLALVACSTTVAAAPAVMPHTNNSQDYVAGRVAGAPRSCVPRSRTGDRSRIFDDHVIAYDGPGSTVYLNRPASCDALTSNHGIVAVSPSAQICRGDIIQVVEFQTGFNFGGCTLGEFTPYTKPKAKPQR